MRALAKSRRRWVHNLGRAASSLSYAPSDTFASSGPQPTTAQGRTPSVSAACFLPDRPHTGLWRPLAAGLTGCLTDAGALVEILIHPGVDELVEHAQLARPAGR
jgi:hypothetical protein